MLFFQKVVENWKVGTATFGKTLEFYLENQWKSMLVPVFPDSPVFPELLTESNLFKGLFYGKCQKVTFWWFYCHLLVTFWRKVTGLGWFDEGSG